MYWRRWRHIHAFIGRNRIALRVQRFSAGADIICFTYATDWWAVIGPVIHGESKSQATRNSSDHVGLLHTLSTIDTQESKLGVCLVLEVLAKHMIAENSSWEFPKVWVPLILEVQLILETRRYSFMRHVSWTLDSGNGLVPSVTKPWPAPIKWLLRSTRLWYLMHWKYHSLASNYQYYNACCTPCSKGQTREIHEFQGPSLLFDTLNPEQINGLVQDCSISSALAMEIL